MYTAEIKRKELLLDSKRLLIDVEYQKDGVRVSSEQITMHMEADQYDVAHRIDMEIKRLEKVDASFATINTGLVDRTLAVASQPTTEEIAKREWFTDFDRLRKLNELNLLGALPVEKIDNLNNLKAKVASGFKTGYINEM